MTYSCKKKNNYIPLSFFFHFYLLSIHLQYQYKEHNTRQQRYQRYSLYVQPGHPSVRSYLRQGRLLKHHLFWCKSVIESEF
jgi:hypothetical protein